MNFSEYKSSALRTAAPCGEVTEQQCQMMHAALGLTTEVLELLRAGKADAVNQVEEIGDCYWYLALLCENAGVFLDLSTIPLDEGKIEQWDLLQPVEVIADMVKRHVFYKLPLNANALKAQIWKAHFLLSNRLANLPGKQKSDVVAAWTANIAKLRRRYPGKFTTEQAANRDLAAERDTVERQMQ